MTVGFSWYETNVGSNFKGVTGSVKVFGEGNMHWVIFVDGIGTIYSQPVSMSLTYSVY